MKLEISPLRARILSWLDQLILWLEEYRSMYTPASDRLTEPDIAVVPSNTGTAGIPGDIKITDAFLRDCATSLWRLRRKLPQESSGSVDPRSWERSLEGVFSSLTALGVEIRDLTGERYDAGLQVRVLGFETTDDDIHDRILETVKPGIFWNGRPVQLPEVIVETSSRRLSIDPT